MGGAPRAFLEAHRGTRNVRKRMQTNGKTRENSPLRNKRTTVAMLTSYLLESRMNRKVHVRFGGQFVDLKSPEPHDLPTDP